MELAVSKNKLRIPVGHISIQCVEWQFQLLKTCLAFSVKRLGNVAGQVAGSALETSILTDIPHHSGLH